MRAIDRFVITLAALLTLAVGGLFLALVAGWNGAPWAIDLIMAARGPARLETGLLALLAVAVGLYLIAAAWRRSGDPGSIRQTGELGDVSVSLRAVESLVLQAASAVRGVREAAVAPAARKRASCLIDVSLLVTSERRVPEVTEEVQERVARARARRRGRTGSPGERRGAQHYARAQVPGGVRSDRP